MHRLDDIIAKNRTRQHLNSLTAIFVPRFLQDRLRFNYNELIAREALSFAEQNLKGDYPLDYWLDEWFIASEQLTPHRQAFAFADLCVKQLWVSLDAEHRAFYKKAINDVAEQQGSWFESPEVLPYLYGNGNSFDVAKAECIALIADTNCDEFENYRAIVQHCGWLFPHPQICVMVERPVSLHFEAGQLHRHDEPAVRYSDDFSIYCIRDLPVPAWIARGDFSALRMD